MKQCNTNYYYINILVFSLLALPAFGYGRALGCLSGPGNPNLPVIGTLKESYGNVPIQSQVFSGPIHFVLDSNFNTSNNAIVVLPDTIAKLVMISGDEIGVFSQAGVLCGAAQYQTGANLAITVWGDDVDTDTIVEGIVIGSGYFFKVWDATEQREYQALAMFQSGTNAYYPDGIEVIKTLKICRFTDSTIMAVACNSYSLNNATYTSSGIYTQILVNSSGCDSTITLQLTINLPPTVTVNSPSICAGESTILTANGAAEYLWNTGETSNAITVNPSSTSSYTVTGTTAGCTSAPTSVQVSVTPIPTITISTNSPTICAGETATLTAVGANTYLWGTGATTNSIVVSPNTTTSYAVTGSTAGCAAAPTSVEIAVNPSPTVELGINIILPDGQDTVLDATCACQSYLWSTGETTATIRVDSMGTYLVTVTNDFGCTASDSIVVTLLSATNTPDDRVRIAVAPNPTRDIIHITCSGSSTIAVQVIDHLGKVVLEDKAPVPDGTTQVISLNKLPAGAYFLRIMGERFIDTIPVIKDR